MVILYRIGTSRLRESSRASFYSDICSFHYQHYYPHAFLKKRRGYCYRLRLSVRPLCYLLLNHWTKFNQIWCVSYSHEWGARRIFFAPLPGALGRDQKVKYHLISITKSISKILFQTLCVFSQMKDTKPSDGFFYSVAWVMP